MCYNFYIFTTNYISLMFCREQMFLHIGYFNNSASLTDAVWGLMSDKIRHDVLKYWSSTPLQYLYNIYDRQFFKPFIKYFFLKKYMK